MNSDYQLYFGDLHNHCAVGYAKGSLERAFEIAREHLDFFAFTGHAHWPDMPTMPEDKHMKWVNGFEVHDRNWDVVQDLTARAYEPGRFVTFLGYEWHSSEYGDYCALYPGDSGELVFGDTVEELAANVVSCGGILIPHHAAYARGWRGIDWEHFPADACPVVETFSEHGCCMTDRGLHPMIRHSNGGRTTEGTVERALATGLRFGLVAGTDDHFGYPGAYGEGLCAVWAAEATREAIWEALKARRTYAVTGDRIRLDFELNGALMGEETPGSRERNLRARVEAMDEIAEVAVLRNGRVMHRTHAPSVLPDDPFEGGRCKLRVQWGWGPWAALDMARTAVWEGEITVAGGRLVRATPCFQSGPYEEHLRDRLADINEAGLSFESYTSRKDALGEDATKAVVLEVDGDPDARVTIAGRQPGEFRIERTLGELMSGTASCFTGPFTSESVLVHRLLTPDSYALESDWTDVREGASGSDYYMVRVTQANGHMAWSSPIWVG